MKIHLNKIEDLYFGKESKKNTEIFYITRQHKSKEFTSFWHIFSGIINVFTYVSMNVIRLNEREVEFI